MKIASFVLIVTLFFVMGVYPTTSLAQFVIVWLVELSKIKWGILLVKIAKKVVY